MKVRIEVVPFVVVAVVTGAVLYLLTLRLCPCPGVPLIVGGGVGLLLLSYFLYFFRDPDRTAPQDPSIIVAGADGVVARIVETTESEYIKGDVVRISIFLSLFNVHVNRAPIAGKSTFLGYFKGRHMFTFKEKSSDVNQHNKILIEGEQTRCLVTQIVGPICRRVVYFLDHDNTVEVKKGDKIGMMKFGSRLDMYFPREDVDVLVKEGDLTAAGVTPVARLKERNAQ